LHISGTTAQLAGVRRATVSLRSSASEARVAPGHSPSARRRKTFSSAGIRGVCDKNATVCVGCMHNQARSSFAHSTRHCDLVVAGANVWVLVVETSMDLTLSADNALDHRCRLCAPSGREQPKEIQRLLHPDDAGFPRSCEKKWPEIRLQIVRKGQPPHSVFFLHTHDHDGFAINPLIMGQKRKHDTGNENSDNASGATPLAPDLHGIFSGLQLLFSPALATDSKSPLRLT